MGDKVDDLRDGNEGSRLELRLLVQDDGVIEWTGWDIK